MRTVEPLEIGLMFWSLPDARETLEKVKQLGFRAGQLGIPGELSLTGQAEAWSKLLADGEFAITTAVCSYAGESYEHVSTVQLTVGLVPAFTRAERVARTKEVADFAAALKIPSVGCHIGFVPHDRNAPLYAEMLTVCATSAIIAQGTGKASH